MFSELIKKILIRTFKISALPTGRVIIESEEVYEFIITKHAYMRFKERVSKDEDLLKKMTVKAWVSGVSVKGDFPGRASIECSYGTRTGYCRNEYRLFGGYLFVFVVTNQKGIIVKKLITVFKSREKNGQRIHRQKRMKYYVRKDLQEGVLIPTIKSS